MTTFDSVLRTARDLPPGSFAIVMATGIVSTAAQLLGWHRISWVLFYLNILLYACLVLLLAIRCTRYRARLLQDFRTHARGAGFFTIVAGTAVLGTEMVVRAHVPGAALALWLLAAALWLFLIYAFFAVMTVLPVKPGLAEGINATWMLLVVSTQSVSVLATLVSPQAGRFTDALLALSACLFLLGCMFYLLLFSLILYRFLFFPLNAADMSPPYWINMGAVAITTLAGSLLALHPDSPVMLAGLRPFVLGCTLLFWATATWWFPLLLVLGAWRHGPRRIAIRYDIQYWSMVFPLGMYAVATWRLSEAIEWPFLLPIPRLVGSFALFAWLLTFLGLARRILRRNNPPDIASPAQL